VHAVLHIPHSSTLIPPDILASIVLSDPELDRELLRMTDAHTDALFAGLADVAAPIVFPVSRLVVDPERFEDDDREPMAGRGMGVIYTETSQRSPLREKLDDRTRGQLLDRFYRPHHARLTAAVDAALERHGHCLLIDCHSFPSKPLPYEVDQSASRPDICIGTDEFHTPPELAALALQLFRAEGFSVELNRPFAGALVPAKHYRTDPRVSGLMVEVNRRLYIDDATGERHSMRSQRRMEKTVCEIIGLTT